MDDGSLAEEWVRPVYMHFYGTHARQQWLLGVRSDKLAAIVAEARRLASRVEPHTVEQLLRGRNWRPLLTASRYAALRGWDQFTDQIGSLLLANEVGFAGQGYTAALACFATDAAAEHLCRYLDRWLPRIDEGGDQGWALAALVWVDGRRRTARAERVLKPGGPWDRYATRRGDGRQESAFALARVQHLSDLTLASTLAALRPE